MKTPAHIKEGEKVWFYHYSTIRHGTIARVSKCKTIVHLTDGRWLHADSCHPKGETK